MTTPIKILVVDDEPAFRSLIEYKFKKKIADKQLDFVFALNGREALEKLKLDPEIGVILIDINMPEMDGLTLLEKLGKMDRLFRTIVISAYENMRNIRVAMNHGASDFITKPIDLNDLEVTIFRTIEQYHFLQQSVKTKEEVAEFYKELEIARNIQRLFLPSDFKPFPNIQSISLYGEMIPARDVGGDFFDFVVHDPHHLSAFIADVSGKGIPAALFMAVCHTLIRGVAGSSTNTADCMKQVNRLLCYKNEASLFITTFYGILDITTGEFCYCNAGHNTPYILSADGSLEQIGENEGVALGIIEEDSPTDPLFVEKKLFLKKNDTLLFYTDGVTEAENSKHQFYGRARLEAYLKKSAILSVDELVEGLKKDIIQFVEGEKQFDDITIFALRYQGN